MSWQVSVHPLAATDLEDARDWYNQRVHGLGETFLDAIEQAFRHLETNALQHRVYYRNVRRMLTTRFPYKIFYLLDGDTVQVLRVLHARRDHISILKPLP